MTLLLLLSPQPASQQFARRRLLYARRARIQVAPPSTAPGFGARVISTRRRFTRPDRRQRPMTPPSQAAPVVVVSYVPPIMSTRRRQITCRRGRMAIVSLITTPVVAPQVRSTRRRWWPFNRKARPSLTGSFNTTPVVPDVPGNVVVVLGAGGRTTTVLRAAASTDTVLSGAAHTTTRVE